MYSITKQNDKSSYGSKEFLCDTEEDLKLLPKNCSPGSIATIIQPFNIYMLNNSGQWVKIS